MIEQNVNHLTQAINNNTIMAHWNIIYSHFLVTYNSAQTYLQDVQYKFNKLIDVIFNKEGIINLISLDIIHQIILNSTATLPTNLQVHPIPEDRVEVETSSECINVFGFFIIIERNEYDLLHINPIPQISNGTYYLPHLKSNTIAINYNAQTYFELDEHAFGLCKIHSPYHYICSAPVINNLDSHPSCVIDELYNRKPKLPCQMMKMTLQGVLWKKLLMDNSWLFFANESSSVAVICNGNREDITINRIGIIKLKEGCHMETKSFIINNFIHQEMLIKATYSKEVIPDISSLATDNEIVLMEPTPISRPTQQLSSLAAQMPTFIPEGSHLGLKHSLSIMSVILVAVVLITCIFKIKSCASIGRRQPSIIRRRHSAPTIRQHFDNMINREPCSTQSQIP